MSDLAGREGCLVFDMRRVLYSRADVAWLSVFRTAIYSAEDSQLSRDV